MNSMSAKLKELIKNRRDVDYAFMAGLTFFILVLIGIGYVGNHLYQRLMNAQKMPLSSLTISGDRPYSQNVEVQQALMAISDSESFFSLDVDQVQALIEQTPWIAKVSVRRQWPNGLQLHIVDQEPVAYWNDKKLINVSGEVFKAPQQRIKISLPHFYGNESTAKTVLEGYKALDVLLKSEGFTLNSITLSPRESWQITVNNDLTLILGRVNTVMRNARVERFIKVYKHVIKKPKAINYVDLRYDTGFAVNWKLESGEKANNEQG